MDAQTIDVDRSRTSSRTWVLVLASVASFMCALDTLVVASALTTIQRDLGATVEELNWTVNAFNLALAVLMMPAAAIGDRFGRRKVFGIGLALFSVASAVCAIAPHVEVLVVARAVQGAGAAVVTSLGLTLVGAAYPAERRGTAIGILQGISGLAVLAGPGLGGAVTTGVGWEWIFWLNVPIGLAVIPLVFVKVRESRGDDTALDLRGVVLIAAAALALVWTLSRGNDIGWSSAEVVLGFAAAVLLTAGFVRVQRRVREPLLPARLFRASGFIAGNIATIGLFAGIFGGVFFFAQFLQVGLGFTALQAGLGLMPWTSPLFVIGPLCGMLADRIGNRPLLVAGVTLKALGFGWIALIAAPGMSYGELVVPLFVAGVGGSMALPAAANAVVGAVAHADVGKAAGSNSMLRELGGVLGLAVMVAVFSGAGDVTSPGSFVAGFAPALGFCTALVACGAIAAAFVPRHGGPAAAH
ncbi:DHA2 family efflux MFS transporter permease subunit [Pseudonocardia sp. TRM90224]|uniref:DHA2 family efflux MFS transporter permease subunit n=1 Tax=Pseudonocardia sp. TRM90224 TaxID=2812678 RepID=UPI001E2FD418|nr:DHA2 family efflux MFS transporter permease subunit [Pseudonocardia sp. TRM90224]